MQKKKRFLKDGVRRVDGGMQNTLIKITILRYLKYLLIFSIKI